MGDSHCALKAAGRGSQEDTSKGQQETTVPFLPFLQGRVSKYTVTPVLTCTQRDTCLDWMNPSLWPPGGFCSRAKQELSLETSSAPRSLHQPGGGARSLETWTDLDTEHTPFRHSGPRAFPRFIRKVETKHLTYESILPSSSWRKDQVNCFSSSSSPTQTQGKAEQNSQLPKRPREKEERRRESAELSEKPNSEADSLF